MNKTVSALLATASLLLAACGSSESTEILASAPVEDQASGQVEGTDRDDSPDADAEPGDTPVEHTNDETAGGDDADGETDDSDDGDEAVDPLPGTLGASLLGNTLDPIEQLSSARFAARIELVGTPDSELPGEITLELSGAYDLANDASEISMDFSGIVEAATAAEGGDMAELELFAGFFEEPLQVITIGNTSWIKWGLLSMFTGAEDMWLEGEAENAGMMSSSVGFDGSGLPTDLLEQLADADADIENLGSDEVRGVQTTHYRALVDPLVFADLGTDLPTTGLPEFPVELWIDDDGLVRRFVVDLSDPALAEDLGDEIERAELVFEMWDYGADLAITPPPADQIISEDELGLSFGQFASLG